jgi:hypothetical protein
MPHEIRIKQGASLLLQLSFVDNTGAPVDLTNATLTAQLRNPIGDLIATLPIVKTDITGVATITVADTHLWPIGMLRTDILCVAAGLGVISETAGVRVERAVTQS